MKPLYESVKEEKSEADKMFEELGYKKEFHIDKNKEKWGEYFYNRFNYCISFDYKDKGVCCSVNGSSKDPIYVTMSELKAINQKCKEMRVVR